MKPIFKYLCIPALITLPASSVYANEVIELPNQRLIGPNHDYTGKDLIIKWTNDGSLFEAAPIRDAQVTAQNITIEADFPDKYGGILNKGIWSGGSNQTVVTATETINITTYDDGIYTESNGKTNINGFKNLNITSKTGYGVVDNGGGINIKGESVEIRSEGIRPAIGNSLHTFFYHLGKGITIKGEFSFQVQDLRRSCGVLQRSIPVPFSTRGLSSAGCLSGTLPSSISHAD